MSWEGEEIIVCKNAHIVNLDPYSDDGSKCPECKCEVVKRFMLDYTNGDEAEAKHNRRQRVEAKKLAEKILRNNPNEIERRIKKVKQKKQEFLNNIQNKLNNYDKEIDYLTKLKII